MSSFDAAARRLHPESYKQEAIAPPVVEKKKKQKKRKAEEPVLPAVGDVIAARGLRKGDDAEARGTVTKIKRAKQDDKKSKRGDRVYRIALEGGGSRKTRLTHLDWRLVRRDTKSFLDTMRSGAKIVAPMVGGSELAFRLLCRRHGANVAYTPMLEASKFLEDAEFKTQFFQTHAEDKPLVAHFCGNDPAIVGAACKEAARLGADAVDLNLGCLHAELAGVSPASALASAPLTSIAIRHTVGLADPIYRGDIPAEEVLDDGLPQALEEYIAAQEIAFLKVKVSGDMDADRERLHAIAALLDQRARGCQITLDGNEQYCDMDAFSMLLDYIDEELPTLWRRILYVEQPLERGERGAHDGRHERRKRGHCAVRQPADGGPDQLDDAAEAKDRR